MRQRSSSTHAFRAHAFVAVATVVLLLAAAVADARNVGTGRGWRSTRYGRTGAEITAEGRYLSASGGGHTGDRNVDPGPGFGFGLMWGISDNIALEGRLLQTDHTTADEEHGWDINLLHVGPRYTFFTENKFQPFVGAGWAKMTIERDTSYSEGGSFERYTGYAWYAAVGVDYIHSSAWSFFVRGDYTKGGYGYQTIGLEGDSIDPPLKGECIAVSLGLSYRIPAW